MKHIFLIFGFLMAGQAVFAQTDLLLGGVKGKDGGSDSTFLKAQDNSAVGKRPTDNVYKPGGTLGIRTTDTSAYMNMQWPANSLKPLNQWNYGDASVNGFNLLKLKSTGQTDNPNVADWNFWVANFPGNNLPFSTRANNVMRFGYNTGGGGGRINPLDADLHIAFESNYNLQQPTLNLPIGARVWEWHLQSQDTLGIAHRSITAVGAHNGRAGGIGFASDVFYLEKYNTPGTNWLQADRFLKNFDFIDSMQLRFDRNGRGGGGIFQRNAAGTSFVDVVYVDEQDRVVNGGVGVPSVYMPSGKLDISGIGEIFNTSGDVITIGTVASGGRTNLEINGATTEVLRMRNFTQPTRVWTHNVGDNHYSLSSYSGNTSLDIYDNAPRFIMANDKVGVGDAAQARLSINQLATGPSDGLQWRNNTTNAAYYSYINASDELVFHGAQANTFIRQNGDLGIGSTPAARLHVYATGGLSTKMLRYQNTTGNTDFYLTGTDPNSSLTGNTGNVAYFNDGTNGAIYGKYSGNATNTGWGKYLNLIDPNSATPGQVLSWNGSTWAPATNTSESTKIGAFTNTATNQGLVLSADSIKMTAADITHPGGVNLTAQVFSAGTAQKTISADNGFQLRLDDPLATKSAGFQLSESGGTNVMVQVTGSSPDIDNGLLQVKVEHAGSLETYIEAGGLNDKDGVYQKGGQYIDVKEISSTAYTVLYGDRVLYFNGSTTTVTLQEIGVGAGQTKGGRFIEIFNDTGTDLTIQTTGGQDINSASTLIVPTGTGVKLCSLLTTAKWIVLN